MNKVYIYIIFILSICPLVELKAQTKEIAVTLDTISIDYCKGNRNFILPVRIGNVEVADSIYGLRMVVIWDMTTIDISDILCSQNTVCYLAEQQSKRIVKDPNGGRIVIEFGNSKNVLRGNLPLVYLTGKVIAKDVTNLPNGWVTIFPQIDFESNKKFTQKIGNGYVKFVKDTTSKNIGDIYFKNGDLDTLYETELSLNIEKLAYKNLKMLNFFVTSDTSKVKIKSWKNAIVYDSAKWTKKAVKVENDTLKVNMELQEELDWGGEFIKVKIVRNSLQDIFTNIDISSVSINSESCVYKINIKGADVIGKKIMKDSIAGVEERVKQNESSCFYSNGKISIRGGGKIRKMAIFDNIGNLLVSRQITENNGDVDIELEGRIVSGKYHLILYGEKSIKEYKQLTIIN